MFVPMNALDKAIDILGGVQATADKFGMTNMGIRQWKVRGIPLARCLALSDMIGGAVTFEELRQYNSDIII